jgi:hypothetical protein
LGTIGKLSYLLDIPGEISVTIFDPLGREVARPAESQWQDVGEHEATIDASNLSPGIYECRLAAAGNEVATRIVVLK